MESRLNKKAEKHNQEFKNEIQKWFSDNNCEISGQCNRSDFLKFIFDFNSLSFDKHDLQKRKRIKNQVPLNDRCLGLRANKEQCTRRKKKNLDFCGTHEKGTPNGIFQLSEENIKCIPCKKLELTIQEIKGIYYYIDNNYNIYHHDDVIQNKNNPRKIGTYTLENDIYNISEFKI
tara:strand:- start:47 stop:571 length:525 start_codon:yes stop_codon:yes gene_type:complete